jgi:hypothetical protein
VECSHALLTGLPESVEEGDIHPAGSRGLGSKKTGVVHMLGLTKRENRGHVGRRYFGCRANDMGDGIRAAAVRAR